MYHNKCTCIIAGLLDLRLPTTQQKHQTRFKQVITGKLISNCRYSSRVIPYRRSTTTHKSDLQQIILRIPDPIFRLALSHNLTTYTFTWLLNLNLTVQSYGPLLTFWQSFVWTNNCTVTIIYITHMFTAIHGIHTNCPLLISNPAVTVSDLFTHQKNTLLTNLIFRILQNNFITFQVIADDNDWDN